MIIYHGSKKKIEKPIVSGSNPHNDYGPAFYLTLDLDSAKSWACKNNELGIVNKYSIRDNVFNNFKVLDLTNREKYSVLNWIAILIHFRILSPTFKIKNKPALDWLEKYFVDVEQYDVIIGYRADDVYFRFPSRFITNDLSLEDLEDVFLSGDLGVQYVFVSERAIKSLSFEEKIDCDSSFINHYYNIVKEASKRFDDLLNKTSDPNKTYLFDLMRKDNE